MGPLPVQGHVRSPSCRGKATADEVASRLAEAGRVLLALPHAGCFPMGWQSIWPAGGAGSPVFLPSAREISAMDEAYGWVAFIDDADERRLVLMRSLMRLGVDGRPRHVWTWRKLRRTTGLHHDTLTAIWGRGIDRIVRRLNGAPSSGRGLGFACVPPVRVAACVSATALRSSGRVGGRPC